MYADGEFTVTRLAKAILESDSYEEFMLRCAADREIAVFLENTLRYLNYPTSPPEYYAMMKGESAEPEKSEFKEAFRRA